MFSSSPFSSAAFSDVGDVVVNVTASVTGVAASGAINAFGKPEVCVMATCRQALRDVPKQSGFPGDIGWPVAPE